MSNINPLGKVPRITAQKDAVHIAILPAIAGEILAPGQFVKINEYNKAVFSYQDSIGVVDPFLRHAILEGNRVYILLHPNTITSLRHDWTTAKPLPTLHVPTTEEAKDWVAEYAQTSDIGLDYSSLMKAADDFLNYCDYLCEGDRWEGVYLSEDFWDYYEIITGRNVPEDDRGSFFSCSC